MFRKKTSIFLSLPLAALVIGFVVGMYLFTANDKETQPVILVAYNSADDRSGQDREGITQALDEIGIPYDLLDVASANVTPSVLQTHTSIILSELNLTAAQAAAVTHYVENGGGIVVTGKSAAGLEPVLGIRSFSVKSHAPSAEIRFETAHPVSYGAFWEGPITQSPPMPQDEIPTISQFLYPNPELAGYMVEPAGGMVIAHWYADADDWGAEQEEAAVVVNGYGEGRAVYAGALPGAYAHPSPGGNFTWRVFIVNAVEWISGNGYLVEIGYWPNAYRTAFIWSGDTESPQMPVAVPAILDLFKTLDLKDFGTFYMVGRRGNDRTTAGAKEHPDIVKMIVEAGSEVGGHGNVHKGFSWGTPGEQAYRLQEMLDLINPLLAPYGASVKGFRAPYVEYTESTFPAAAQAGLLYDSSTLDVWANTTLPFHNGHLWEAPPTMLMDWHLFELYNLSDVDGIAISTDKFDYVYARRGMFNFLNHPWVIHKHMDVLQEVLQHAIDKGDVWMARQDAVLEWWVHRNSLTLPTVSRNGHEIRVALQNTSDTPIADATIWLKLPEGAESDRFSARTDGGPLVVYPRSHNGMTFLAVVVPSIDAHSTISVQMVPTP